MTAYGRTPINWKEQFPVLRVALGRLGELGFRNRNTADFLLMHRATAELRRFSLKTRGAEVTAATLAGRMTHPDEIEWYRKNAPSNYTDGVKLGDDLAKDLLRAGFIPSVGKK